MAGLGGGEDDYMGDLSQFVSPSENLGPVKKQKQQQSCSNCGTRDGKRNKGQKGQSLSWQEKKRRDRIQKQKEDDERTRQSLETPIPDSNVGFKLLQRMGYQPSPSSMEPIGVDIRRSRAGIGVEEEQRRKDKEERENKRKRYEDIIEDFGESVRARFNIRKIRSDFHKAELALAQLENKDFVPEPKKEDDEEEEEEVQIITQEDLNDILMKLRDEHYYCLYCGCQYESEEELISSCPGKYEEDH